jgi:hypothetical protein
MTKKELEAATDADLVDWLCYACWREYNSACRRGDARAVERKISMLKEEIEKRMK